MGQMYLVFNHYVQLGYTLSLSLALDVAKEYFKDERDRESFKKQSLFQLGRIDSCRITGFDRLNSVL